MSSTWYYGLDSKVHGPVDDNSLQVLFQKGTLKKTDLILKDGHPDWKAAQDWVELQPFFQQRESLVQDSVPLPEFNEKWDSNSYVVLFRKLGSSKPTQDGPFSLEEVKKMLQEKTLSTEDKIWQKHFLDWKSVGQLPEFDIYHWKLDSERQEKLSTVVEYEKPAASPAPEKDDFLARLDRWEADLEPQSQVSFKLPAEKNANDFLGEASFALPQDQTQQQEKSVGSEGKKGIFIRHAFLTLVSLLGLSAAGFFAFQQYQELQRKAGLLTVPPKTLKGTDVSSVPVVPPTVSSEPPKEEVEKKSVESSSELKSGTPASTSAATASSQQHVESVKQASPAVSAPSVPHEPVKVVEKTLPLKLKMETKKSFKEVQVIFQNIPSKTDKIFYVLKGNGKSLASVGGYRRKGSEKVKNSDKLILQFGALPLGKYALIYHGPEIQESEFLMDVGSDSKAWKVAMTKLGSQKTKARSQELLLLKDKIQQHLLWVKTTKGLLKNKKSKLGTARKFLQKLRVGPLLQVEKNISTLDFDETWTQLDEISKDLEDLIEGDDLSQTNLQEVQKDLLSMLKKLK